MEKIQLYCPHGFKVKTNTLFGVIVYIHEEDNLKPCKMLNTLDQKPEAIAKLMFLRKGIVCTPEVVALIGSSDHVRKSAYEQLSKMKGKELIAALKEYVDIIDKIRIVDKTIVIRELVNAFGKTVVTNLKLVSGVNYDQYIRSDMAKYPMEKILPSQAKDVIGAVEYRIAQAEENIDSIIFGIPPRK